MTIGGMQTPNMAYEMRILVASSTFPGSELDGSRPRFVYDLAEALAEYATVFALAPHHPGAAMHERMGSVEVERFQYWWPSGAERLTPNIREQIRVSVLARLQVPFFFLAQFRALRRIVIRNQISVVNAHWMIPQGLTAALVRGASHPRFLLALHAHAADIYQLAKLPFGRSLARFVASRSNLIFAAGSHVRDTMDDLLGYESQARIQPMGVHGAMFARTVSVAPMEASAFPDGFILFVGRFVEKKGAVYLIRALPQVLKRYPGLGLLMVGSGPEEAVLRSEAQELGLQERVRFLGHRPHNDIVTYLQYCRAAVVPSIVDRFGETEGMPTVVVEALAAGVRVIGSAVDGIPDVIRHAENGWLSREKDPEDLASKLLLALEDESNSSVVKAARKTAILYDWSRVAGDYMKAIEGCLGTPMRSMDPRGASP